MRLLCLIDTPARLLGLTCCYAEWKYSWVPNNKNWTVMSWGETILKCIQQHLKGRSLCHGEHIRVLIIKICHRVINWALKHEDVSIAVVQWDSGTQLHTDARLSLKNTRAVTHTLTHTPNVCERPQCQNSYRFVSLFQLCLHIKLNILYIFFSRTQASQSWHY